MEAITTHRRVPFLREALALAALIALAIALKPHALLLTPALALAARRFGDAPTNDTREGIAAFVRARPGATIMEVAEHARVTHPTAKYHLDILERSRAISSQRWGNKRMYFPRAGALDPWERELLSLLRSEEASTVLATVVANPRTYPQEVAAREGLSRLTVTAHARALQGLGLVHLEREGRIQCLVADKALIAQRGAALAAKLPQEDAARRLLEELVHGL